MTVVMTSISPKHTNGDVQKHAIESWKELGFRVLSFNAPSEIEVLKAYYDVEFVPCFRTMEGLFNVPYVPISAFIDYAKEHGLEQVMLINSDIVIKDETSRLNDYLGHAHHGLIFSNRHDHNGDFQNPTVYSFGFDVFVIHKNFYYLIPQSMFCMGQTWWDYWIPYRFITNKIPAYLVKETMFYHMRHNVQYSTEQWNYMTRHFQWIENFMPSQTPAGVNHRVYRTIRQSAI